MNLQNPQPSGLRVTLRLEIQPSGTIVASVIEFPDCRVEAATREDAIAKVQAAFLERFAHIETIPWDVLLPSAKPIYKHSAEVLEDNSAVEDIMNRIQAERNAWGDQEMDVSEYTR